MIENAEYIIITDIGSTTTKGLLLKYDQNKSGYIFKDQCDTFTTVEKPFEDVRIGVSRIINTFEKRNDVRIKDDDGKMLIPYLTTSSAGGGLQIMVFGLTKNDTGKNAEITAYGAGGVVLRTFTIDDCVKDMDKIKIIQDLNPDMILMAGGYDGYNTYGIMRLLQILFLSRPVPRFVKNLKVPLIYCGNQTMIPQVKALLKDTLDVFITPNIRPDPKILNFEPAKQEVHRVFKEFVMERAPGYADLKSLTSTEILPTPTGVENILALYAKKSSENAFLVDMGGATTDIYSWIKGDFRRSVSANVGLSFSLANILALIIKNNSFNKLLQHLPSSYNEANIRNYLNNKTINPAYLPVSDPERLLEQVCAVIGFEISWQQHLDLNFNNVRDDFWDKRKYSRFKKNIKNNFNTILHLNSLYHEKKFVIDRNSSFYQSDIDVVIGSGGVIAYAKNVEEQIFMLTEGFKPYGVTKLCVDKPFKVSHMGMLSVLDPHTALDLFERECLTDIAYVVAPVGMIWKGRRVLSVRILNTGKKVTISGGKFLYFPNGGDFEFSTRGTIGVKVTKNLDFFKLNTKLPVLIDCRGRDKYLINNPLLCSGIKEFSFNYGNFHSNIPLNKIDTSLIKPETRLISRLLPYNGDIQIKAGDNVSKEQIVALNKGEISNQHLLDLASYEDGLNVFSAEEFRERILVQEGQLLEKGDPLFKGFKYNYSAKFEHDIKKALIVKLVEHIFPTPYKCKVKTVYYDTGLLIVEEVFDYLPHEIDIAQSLKVKPNEILKYMNAKLGDFVREDQIIAQIITESPTGTSEYIKVNSPATGFVKEINTVTGFVKIQYEADPFYLNAFVDGRITKVVENHGVMIESNSIFLQGAIGFGGENTGRLKVGHFKDLQSSFTGTTNEENTIIAVKDNLTTSMLEWIKNKNIKGVIAPSIDNKEWVNYHKKEIGVAITGDEDLGYSIVLIEGFGTSQLDDGFFDYLKRFQDQNISISGRTQIRAGIIRPQIILPVNIEKILS
jgi:hypothetical protein